MNKIVRYPLVWWRTFWGMGKNNGEDNVLFEVHSQIKMLHT